MNNPLSMPQREGRVSGLAGRLRVAFHSNNLVFWCAMKDLLTGALSTLFAILVVFLLGEASIRVWHVYKENFSDQMNPRVIALDDVQGWLPVRNYRYRGDLLDASGAPYRVNIETDAHGYRVVGEGPSGAQKKVLFLGDSFTHAMQVSNDKTYYGLLAEELGIEAFALGVNGYGTLQQYLLLDSIIDGLQPDVVILQFCPNDFINNHYDLELQSAQNNNALRRPYLTNGEVVYKIPTELPALREFAARYSKFLYFILAKLDLLKPPPEPPAEQLIAEQGEAYPHFEESIAVTDELLAKIRARVPPTIPVYTFSTHHQKPYLKVFKALSEKNDIHFIEGTSQAVMVEESAGVTTRAADGAHWNNAGHRSVANVLRDYLKDKL
ncbi:MAG: SGNH/GDSL hydrolase family protein [Halioglobus sp.]|nr:SGNH/GDSL hydrolase family protein [Halioglobus sp.]